MARRIVLLVCDGFTDSSLAVALDVFRTANALARDLFRIDVASPRGGPVRAASGLTLAHTRTARLAARADVVVVPGLWVESAAAIDAALERAEVRALVRIVGAAHRRGAIVSASCAGVFLLAESGALDGARATTTWWLASHLKRRRPAVQVDAAAALVAHERLLTAGAVFAIADLALHLVARFAGPSIAHRCAGLLLLDEHPSQTPYMAVHQLGANDRLVRSAEAWIRAHLADDFDIAQLSKSVGVSPRTLSRKLALAVGLSPIAFVQRVRVETAVHRLRTTRASIEEISASVGYADTGTLRRLIRRETHTSPRELRRRRSRTDDGAR